VDYTTTPFQRLIGQTEKTLNAILDRQLAGAVSEPQWVALVLIANAGASDSLDQLTAQLAGALKTDTAAAADHLGQLTARGLVRAASGTRPGVMLTEAGQQLVDRVQSWAGQLTDQLWGDLPASDMDIARQVLGIVLERAEARLAIAS
jgi:DNA-binding MarR family transcriptional regulator